MDLVPAREIQVWCQMDSPPLLPELLFSPRLSAVSGLFSSFFSFLGQLASLFLHWSVFVRVISGQGANRYNWVWGGRNFGMRDGKDLWGFGG